MELIAGRLRTYMWCLFPLAHGPSLCLPISSPRVLEVNYSPIWLLPVDSIYHIETHYLNLCFSSCPHRRNVFLYGRCGVLLCNHRSLLVYFNLLGLLPCPCRPIHPCVQRSTWGCSPRCNSVCRP